MSRERRNFRFCYERELQLRNDPQYKGRVTMRFKIGVDGAVSGNPAIESATLKGKALHQCLVKVFAAKTHTEMSIIITYAGTR